MQPKLTQGIGGLIALHKQALCLKGGVKWTMNVLIYAIISIGYMVTAGAVISA
jgi:hypothetical protein